MEREMERERWREKEREGERESKKESKRERERTGAGVVAAGLGVGVFGQAARASSCSEPKTNIHWWVWNAAGWSHGHTQHPGELLSWCSL